MFNCLKNPENLKNLDTELLHSQTAELRKAERTFNKNFQEKIMAVTDKKERSRLCNEFLNQENFEPNNLTAEQTALIFNTFKSAGDFEKMVDLYEKSSSAIFKKSPVIKELLAVALNKTGIALNKKGETQKGNEKLEESQKIIGGLIQEEKTNGEIYAILGKIQKIKFDKLQSDGSNQEAQEMLKKSVESLEKGFLIGFEFYPGINLVYNEITTGFEQNDYGKINKALKKAEIVQLATEKAGGINSNDFWTLTTMLETSIITGKECTNILNKVIEKGNVEWEINAPIENLQRLKKQLENTEKVNQKDKILQNIDQSLTGLENRLEEIQGKSVSEKVTESTPKTESANIKKRVTDFIFDKGFSYGEIATFAGGNIRYGGQLHDHVVNRWDISVAKEFLKSSGLQEVQNFNQFNEKIDNILRERYNTMPLEDLHSQEHEKFDNFMKKLNGVMNVEKGDDSRTNVMLDFWLGRGDCRQHAYTKQLFFDVWKISNINQLLAESYSALDNNDENKFQESIKKAQELTNLQMMVFDSTIKAPIQMEQKYQSKKIENKLLLTIDGEMQEVEDHTWNGLAKLDEDGLVSDFFLVDSFYQNEYNLGGRKTTLPDGTEIAGIKINPDEVIDRGFDGGQLEAYNSKNKSVEKINVRLSPAVYAGNREKRMLPFMDDLGLPQLRGLIVSDFVGKGYNPDVSNFFDKEAKASIDNFINSVIKHGESNKTTLADSIY